MAEMMGEMDIAFPNLGIYLVNVPKTIMIGNFGRRQDRTGSGYDLGPCREPYYLLDHRRQDLLCDLYVGLLQG